MFNIGGLMASEYSLVGLTPTKVLSAAVKSIGVVG